MGKLTGGKACDNKRQPQGTTSGGSPDYSHPSQPPLNISAARASTLRVLADIGIERQRQEAKWGLPAHPDMPAGVTHPNAFFGIPTEAAGKLLCDDAAKRGTLSHGHILLEEVCEAYAAIGNPAALRAELVQVAAVATAWVECIDRRGTSAVAPEVRHA